MGPHSQTWIRALLGLVVGGCVGCSGERAAVPSDEGARACIPASGAGAGRSAASAAASGCAGEAVGSSGGRAGSAAASGTAAGSAAAPRAGSGGSAGTGASGPAGVGSEASGAAGEAGASGAAVQAGQGAAGEAATAGAGGEPAAACGSCDAYSPPELLGTLQVPELEALSGAAVSRRQPEIVFAHNDRARPVVYALNLKGELRARITLDGASATDTEDIALGPCGANQCVFLADIGDNAMQRSDYAILRFAEPTIALTGDAALLALPFERIRFRYEDGSHNAEGFFVDPSGGTLYIVTKLASGGPSSVYRVEPADTEAGIGRAVKVVELPVPTGDDMAISAADAQPCGLGFVVRTYDTIYEFRAPTGGPFELAFRAEPRAIDGPSEPQSEAISYLADGRGVLTSGEGASAPLFVMRCR